MSNYTISKELTNAYLRNLTGNTIPSKFVVRSKGKGGTGFDEFHGEGFQAYIDWMTNMGLEVDLTVLHNGVTFAGDLFEHDAQGHMYLSDSARKSFRQKCESGSIRNPAIRSAIMSMYNNHYYAKQL
jgi:hypothetical protein